jgi:hypothetical protein
VIARLLPAAALAASLSAAEAPGIRPLATAAEYPAHVSQDGLTIGAALLTPDQVRKHFVSDIHRAYLVVEVGVYPAGPAAFRVEPDAFLLRIPGQRASRPASPKAVAGVLQKTAPSQSDVTVYPSVGIGYESGPRRYDPVTGDTRGGGWRTGVGVGVGVGGTRPASTEADRKTMEIELSEKGLPEGSFSKPVAGYLYFPLPAGKRPPAAYELEYDAPAGKLLLVLK